MSSPGTISLSIDGAIATVVLDRQTKLNALTQSMWRELGRIITELSVRAEIRCIVLRGAGTQSFSPGNDIGEFASERSNVSQAQAYGAVMHATLGALRDCPAPLVALIHGICVGGGLEIAALCDLRICGASSRFGVPINRLGLTMAHAEVSALVKLVGPAIAKEILLEGRIFGAAEAERKGLVTRVVPDAEVDAEGAATAQRIADGAPLVARWHKQFIRRLADSTPLTADELAEGFACFGTEDFQIGYRAFLAKKPPEFKGK